MLMSLCNWRALIQPSAMYVDSHRQLYVNEFNYKKKRSQQTGN